jgi:hypothetical protein
MGKKAIAFLVKPQVAWLELACSRCPIVLQLSHDPLAPLPRHRCRGQAVEFDIALQLDEPVVKSSRIDNYWHS